MPSKSQIALALETVSRYSYGSIGCPPNVRLGIEVIQKATSILFGEHAGESPRLVL